MMFLYFKVDDLDPDLEGRLPGRGRHLAGSCGGQSEQPRQDGGPQLHRGSVPSTTRVFTPGRASLSSSLRSLRSGTVA